MKDSWIKPMSGVLRWSMEAVFLIGLGITATLPYTLKRWFFWYFWGDEAFYRFILIMMIFCGLSALIILRQLVTIFKSISNSTPFVQQNVKSLRNIALCCFAIAVMFFIKCFFYLTFLTAVVSFMFVIMGFSAIVFSALFRQAVAYKSENDLTI